MTDSVSIMTISPRPSRGINLSRKKIRQRNEYLKHQAESSRAQEVMKMFHHRGGSLEVKESQLRCFPSSLGEVIAVSELVVSLFLSGGGGDSG